MTSVWYKIHKTWQHVEINSGQPFAFSQCFPNISCSIHLVLLLFSQDASFCMIPVITISPSLHVLLFPLFYLCPTSRQLYKLRQWDHWRRNKFMTDLENSPKSVKKNNKRIILLNVPMRGAWTLRKYRPKYDNPPAQQLFA